MPRASRTVLFLITDREEWNALAAVKYACANILEPSRDAVTFVFSRMEQGAAMVRQLRSRQGDKDACSVVE